MAARLLPNLDVTAPGVTLDAEGLVDLSVGQRPLARGSGHDELANKLDLVSQSVVGELSTAVVVHCHKEDANRARADKRRL